MRGPEHYLEAQNLLHLASDHPLDADEPYLHEQYLIGKAQVHATLALAAAMAMGAAGAVTGVDREAWRQVTR